MTLARKTLQQAMEYAQVVIESGLTPYIAGSPGCGKSAGIAKICKVLDYKMIDIRLAQEDPTTINGFPDTENGRSRYLPPEIFPLEGLDNLPLHAKHIGTPVETDYTFILAYGSKEEIAAFQANYCFKGWLVFFDELPAAPRSVQAAAYKIILDRMIGTRNIHPCCHIAAAGNLMTDNAIANEMGTALRSRMIHIHVDSDSKDYINYTVRAKYDMRIPTYLAYREQHVNNFTSFNNNSSDETFCCERTWEFVNKLLPQISPNQSAPIPEKFTDLLCGTIGSYAIEFVAYTAAFKDLPTFAEVISNPFSVTIPDKPSVKYLLMGMLVGNASLDNIDVIMDYVSRFSKEYGFIFVKMLWAKNDAYLSCPKVEKLFLEVSDMMMG